jgi:hypothetical protein
MRYKVQTIAAKALEWYFSLSTSQKLYINALLVLVYVFVFQLFVEPKSKLTAWAVFFTFWAAAILHDLLRAYSAVYGNLLGRAAILLIFSLSVNFSITLAAQMVNGIVGVDPSKFPRAIALLSVLTIPFFAVALLFAAQLILIIVAPFALMFHTLPNDHARRVFVPNYKPSCERYRGFSITFRVVSIILFVGMALALSERGMKAYNVWLSNVALNFIYKYEMFERAPCTFSNGGRVAFVGDGLIAVGKKAEGRISVTMQECK